ncbi:MAG: universal stress protein [Gammaproteobacteria bacterium]|nr:universal stress protein [Gammaproteobacteria bacterium]NCF83796.1 universal stress protein [Pseudomonadota bacterium]
MTIRDILVHVDKSRAMPGRVRAAAEFARRHDAHLTGLYVIEVPVLPSYAEAQIPVDIIEAQRAALISTAAAAESEFGDIVEKSGISSEWRCVEDRLIDALSLNARYADLLMVGQADPEDPECVSRGLADHLALSSGRPVLVIPTGGVSGVIGENVVVAWNAKREAVRAISDAMPLLETANQVSVVTINAKDEDPENAGIPAADIGLHLARHGIETQTRSLYGAPAAIGELLLYAARDESADLLVMGAYGHARFREILLGGVTAHVLAHTTIPTLLAH